MEIITHYQWQQAFLKSCDEGILEDLRHLCQTQYLDLQWADIHMNHDAGFRMACEEGHLEVVKYLLTSPELIEAGHSFANLHDDNDDGFRGACEQGHLDVVKYLLTSKELKETGYSPIDVHAFRDQGFHLACANEHWNVIRWLVMDYGIEKTPAIEALFQHYPQAQEYFRVREELDEIQGVLKNNDPDKMTDPPSERTDNRSVKKPKKL